MVCVLVVGSTMENVNISEAVLPSAVERFIQIYIKENSLGNVKIVSRPAVSKGNNFMGIIDRVTITADQHGKETELNLIVKVPVSDEALHNVFSLNLFFEREIYIYKNIAKLYDDIQRDVPDAEKFKFPNCYFTNSAKPEVCILLEDLVKEDFKVHHRLKRVDFEHASLAMEAIGKMHGMSFYVQENTKEKFALLKKTLVDVITPTFYPQGRDSENKLTETRLEEMLNVLDCEEHKGKLSRFAANLYDHLNAPNLDPYTVLAHGDFWISNMLFKYKNDKPVDIRLVDYQMSRFAPPVVDLVYFICCCTDGEFRKLHYDDILEVYYNALSKQLSYFSIKPSDVYPRRVFYEQLKRYFAYGIGCAIISLVNGTRDEADALDMSEVLDDYMNEDNKAKNMTSKLFKSRTNDLVRDCISYGYL